MAQLEVAVNFYSFHLIYTHTMKNHSLLLVKLMVALMLIIAMNSCGKYSAVSHAKKHGLVTRGCRGIDGLHKSHFMK
jgi:hypothetical protein